MVQAREQARDPLDVLDEMIGWDRLVASREEIDALDDLATEDPPSLAASRYAQLRRFGPAFLEAFEFDAPSAGRSQHAAVELLRELVRSGRRKLPVMVPMLFAPRQWKALVADNAKTARRTYEATVVATLRDRLRAGGVHRPRLHLRQRGADRVPGGVVGAVALADDPLHHPPDAKLQPARGRVLLNLQRQQHRHQVRRVNGVHGLAPDVRGGPSARGRPRWRRG